MPEVELPHDFPSRCGDLLALVGTWNAHINLTGADDPESLADIYAADALLLAAHAKPGESWLDVGSGGGAPGLVFAMATPQTRVTLVEPRQKRVSFLRNAVGALRLENVEIVRGRFEDLPDRPYGTGWDNAVSRATWAPEEWLRIAEQVQPECVWILSTDADCPSSAERTCNLHQEYTWPLSGLTRNAFRFTKARRKA